MILILVGQRRVGKSYILRLLKEWLLSNRPGANVVYINKELKEFGTIKTEDDLYNHVSPLLPEGADNYLLIDEVQDIEDYENALRSLHAEGRCQIVATGSNAYIFSSELSTRLAGRYIEIPIYALSYPEFLAFHNLENSEASLLQYLRVGGLPGLRHFDLNDDAQLRDYLQGVYNTVMVRDVLTREKVRNVSFIETLSVYIADNIGKPISVSNIARYLRAQGEEISEPVVSTYLRHLCNALLLRKVSRFDIHGKKLFEQNNKFYFSDHGLRNMLSGFDMRGSIEKVMENVIYLHLLMAGFTVTVGAMQAGEIDFVATRGAERIYIQSTYLLGSEATVEREFGNLMQIRDNYPKYVISMDPVTGPLNQYPGIHHIHLREFLSNPI